MHTHWAWKRFLAGNTKWKMVVQSFQMLLWTPKMWKVNQFFYSKGTRISRPLHHNLNFHCILNKVIPIAELLSTLQLSTVAVRHLTGLLCASNTAKQEWVFLNSFFQIHTVLSADPLHTKSNTTTKHRIAFVCPLSVPTATILSLLDVFSHTIMDWSRPPEYNTDVSILPARALTADLCFFSTSTKMCFLYHAFFLHTLIFLAEPE